MKKLYILCLLLCSIFIIHEDCFSATVGNPVDFDIPKRSAFIRQQLIEETLDEQEQAIKIKASFDAEFLFNKYLSATSEVGNAELKGQWYMVKLGTTVFDKVEPYIKIGSSNLKAEWRQNNQFNIDVQSDMGFAWGYGLKAVLLDFQNQGIRLTGDIQYRTTNPDVSEITRESIAVADKGAEFDVSEYQASLILSKKFELPLKWQSVYLVPYTGLTLSQSTVDVNFRDPDMAGADFSLFEASNEDAWGFFVGCDIVPALTSSFIYSIEVRLINELALTLGANLKF